MMGKTEPPDQTDDMGIWSGAFTGTVWLAGRNFDGPHSVETHLGPWCVLGVYSSEELAIKQCRIPTTDWIAPIALDQDAPRHSVCWPGAYFPLIRQ